MELATAQIITNIQPIPDADKIQVASVLGWQVVINKNDGFKVGDLVAYIQIDTVTPATEQFAFLKERKHRVRTIKLRRQLSQGLIVPLPNGRIYSEGDNLTETLGITKYEKPDNNPQDMYTKLRMPKVWHKKVLYILKYNYLYRLFPGLRRKQRSPFPKHLVSITDEDRIQNMPNVLNTYRGKIFCASYKLDGSSITIIHNKIFGRSNLRICSRRFELHNKNNDWYRVFENTNFKREVLKLVKHYKTNDIIVQGECIGKFNGSHHNVHPDQIRLFNIYVRGIRLKPGEFIQTCMSKGIPHCPFYKWIQLDYTLPEILKESEIMDILNPTAQAEGLVWRCIEDGLSFKVINNRCLLDEK